MKRRKRIKQYEAKREELGEETLRLTWEVISSDASTDHKIRAIKSFIHTYTVAMDCAARDAFRYNE